MSGGTLAVLTAPIVNFGFLPASVRSNGGDVLWLAGGLSALLAAWVALRNNMPVVARRVAAPFRALRWLLVGLLHVPRWLWRQLWRDASGRSRGPVVRGMDRARRGLAGVVHDVTAPQFQSVRDAAKSQHDEQNERLDGITERVGELGTRIAHLETTVANPPPRPHLSRSTDRIPDPPQEG